jgi:type II secretory pathway component PulF
MKTTRSFGITAMLVAAVVVLWIAVVVVLVAVVPRYERAFADEARKLPVLTECVIICSRWAYKYWYVLVLFGLPGVVMISWLLRHRLTRSLPAWIWFGALLGIPVLIQLGIWLALLLP